MSELEEALRAARRKTANRKVPSGSAPCTCDCCKVADDVLIGSKTEWSQAKVEQVDSHLHVSPTRQDASLEIELCAGKYRFEIDPDGYIHLMLTPGATFSIFQKRET